MQHRDGMPGRLQAVDLGQAGRSPASGLTGMVCVHTAHLQGQVGCPSCGQLTAAQTAWPQPQGTSSQYGALPFRHDPVSLYDQSLLLKHDWCFFCALSLGCIACWQTAFITS